MATTARKCSDDPGPLGLVFACSGAADTAQITDLAARRLSAEGRGQMFCLAGIGGRVSPIMKRTAAASKIVVIDGCELDCARKTLEEGGFSEFDHLRVTDLGMKKGQSPATDEKVAVVVARAESLLG